MNRCDLATLQACLMVSEVSTLNQCLRTSRADLPSRVVFRSLRGGAPLGEGWPALEDPELERLVLEALQEGEEAPSSTPQREALKSRLIRFLHIRHMQWGTLMPEAPLWLALTDLLSRQIARLFFDSTRREPEISGLEAAYRGAIHLLRCLLEVRSELEAELFSQPPDSVSQALLDEALAYSLLPFDPSRALASVLSLLPPREVLPEERFRAIHEALRDALEACLDRLEMHSSSSDRYLARTFVTPTLRRKAASLSMRGLPSMETPNRALAFLLSSQPEVATYVAHHLPLSRDVTRWLTSPESDNCLESYAEVMTSVLLWDAFSAFRKNVTWLERREGHLFLAGQEIAAGTPLIDFGIGMSEPWPPQGTVVALELVGLEARTREVAERRGREGVSGPSMLLAHRALEQLFALPDDSIQASVDGQWEGDVLHLSFAHALPALRFALRMVTHLKETRWLESSAFTSAQVNPFQDGVRIGLGGGAVGRLAMGWGGAAHDRMPEHRLFGSALDAALSALGEARVYRSRPLPWVTDPSSSREAVESGSRYETVTVASAPFVATLRHAVTAAGWLKPTPQEILSSPDARSRLPEGLMGVVLAFEDPETEQLCLLRLLEEDAPEDGACELVLGEVQPYLSFLGLLREHPAPTLSPISDRALSLELDIPATGPSFFGVVRAFDDPFADASSGVPPTDNEVNSTSREDTGWEFEDDSPAHDSPPFGSTTLDAASFDAPAFDTAAFDTSALDSAPLGFAALDPGGSSRASTDTAARPPFSRHERPAEEDDGGWLSEGGGGLSLAAFRQSQDRRVSSASEEGVTETGWYSMGLEPETPSRASGSPEQNAPQTLSSPSLEERTPQEQSSRPMDLRPGVGFLGDSLSVEEEEEVEVLGPEQQVDADPRLALKTAPRLTEDSVESPLDPALLFLEPEPLIELEWRGPRELRQIFKEESSQEGWLSDDRAIDDAFDSLFDAGDGSNGDRVTSRLIYARLEESNGQTRLSLGILTGEGLADARRYLLNDGYSGPWDLDPLLIDYVSSDGRRRQEGSPLGMVPHSTQWVPVSRAHLERLGLEGNARRA